MAPESREWSVPAPVRMLLWWPAISFVLVIVDPDAATGAIVVAGLALAVLGGLIATAARRFKRTAVAPAAAAPVAEEATMEMHLDMPTMEIPSVDGQARRRAA